MEIHFFLHHPTWCFFIILFIFEKLRHQPGQKNSSNNSQKGNSHDDKKRTGIGAYRAEEKEEILAASSDVFKGNNQD